MNKKAMREFLRTILDNLRDSSNIDIAAHNAVLIFGGDETVVTLQSEGEPPLTVRQDPQTKIGPSFALVDDGCKALGQYISEIDGDPQLHGKLGASIQNNLVARLRELRNEKSVSDSELDNVIADQLDRLRAEIQAWTNIAPIDNLRFTDLSELKVGNVTFQPFPSVRQRVLDELSQRIDKNPSSDQEKQQLKALMTQQLDQHYGSNIIAETVVEGTESRQQYIAYSEIEASLNLLRCFTHLLFPWDTIARLGMRGQISFLPRPSIGFGHADPSWALYFDKITVLPFILTASQVDHLRKKFSFDTLGDVLAKPETKRTKLEQAVVTCIRWLGRGVDAPDLPEKVLNFAAASERLLIGDDENKTEIAERFTRRLAFLITNDPKQRLRFGKRARELYKVRNAVIHAGRTDIEIGDVNDMEFFAVHALIRMAARLDEWKAHKQFADWVEAQIYQASNDSENS